MHLSTFWHTFFNTLTNPKYYVDILNSRLRTTVRFLVMSYLLLSVLAASIVSLVELPKLTNSLQTYLNQVATEFPEQQELSWNGLQLTSKVPGSQLILGFPYLPDTNGVPNRLLIVDTTIENANQIPSLKEDERSVFVIGKQRIFIAQPSGGWSDMLLTDVLTSDSFAISKASLVESLPDYQKQLTNLMRILPIVFFAFFFLVAFPLRVLNVLLDSLMVYLIVRLFRLPLGFKKVIQLSLHIAVAAELVAILTAQFSSGLPMFSIAFWGYMMLVYWQLRNVKALSLIEEVRQGK